MKNLLLGLMLAATSLSVNADFKQAVKNYEAGEYEEALSEFQSLAEIGNKDAQYNLGMMYLDGLGAKQDLVKAYAWIKLSDEDATKKSTQDVLQQIKKHLLGKQEATEKAYLNILDKFGQAATVKDLIPVFSSEQKNNKSAIPLSTTPAEFPIDAISRGKNGWVNFSFDVDIDGLPMNIEVLDSHPGRLFVRNAKRAINRWKFKPAVDEFGKPIIAQNVKYTMEFYIEETIRAGSEKDRVRRKEFKADVEKQKETILDVKNKAISGDAVMQYYYAKYGKSLLKDDSINPTEWYYKSAVQGVADSQYELALSLLEGRGCKQDKIKGVNWLLKAASGNLPLAQLELAKAYKNENSNDKLKFWVGKAVDSSKKLLQDQYEVSRFVIYELNSKEFSLDVISLLKTLDISKYENNHDFYNMFAKAYAKNNDFNNAVVKINKAIQIHKNKFGGISKTLKDTLAEYKANI